MIRRRPIAMTVEQRADDAAIQNSGKRLVLFRRLPFGNDLAVLRKAANPQSLRIRRAAPPARIVRSILFLERLVTHGWELQVRRQSAIYFYQPVEDDSFQLRALAKVDRASLKKMLKPIAEGAIFLRSS